MPDATWTNLPFDKAISFFKQKLSVPTSSYAEIIGEAQDWAFTVAGITKAELLNDIFKAILKALEDGTTLSEFTRDFETATAKAGWQPPPGQEQRWGSWRMQLIYMQNIQGAYSAGRFQQMRDPDVASDRPYWLWRHRDSRLPRPTHLALDGKVFRGDSVFWESGGYPPCGYGCRCGIFALSDRDLERRGLKVEDAPTETLTIADKLTGERQKIPALNGQPIVDPGFAHAAGSSKKESREAVLKRSISRLPEKLQKQVQEAIGKAQFSEVDFATPKRKKQKQCTKGFSCGYSCIAKEQGGKKQQCRSGVEGRSAKYASWMRNQTTYSSDTGSTKLKAEVESLRATFGRVQDEFNAIQGRMLKGEKLQAELEVKRSELLDAQTAYSAKKRELRKLANPETTKTIAQPLHQPLPVVEERPDPNDGKTFKAFIKDGTRFFAESGIEDIKALKASAQALAKIDKAIASKFAKTSVLYEKMVKLDASDAPEEVKKKSYFDFKKAQSDYTKFDLDSYSESDRLIAAIEPAMAKIRQRLIDRSDPAVAKALAEKLLIRDSVPAEMRQTLRNQMEDFYKVTGGKAERLAIIEKTDDRAHANSFLRNVNVGANADREDWRVLWHEAAHHIEFESKGMSSAAKLWIEARATGAPQKLKDLVKESNYEDREIAYPDKFVSPYIGKVYSYDSTEVISMGVEHFNTPARMVKLYSKDPEHFHFILGAIL